MTKKIYKISYKVLPNDDIKQFLTGNTDYLFVNENYGEYKIYMLNMYFNNYYQFCFSKNNILLKLSDFKVEYENIIPHLVHFIKKYFTIAYNFFFWLPPCTNQKSRYMLNEDDIFYFELQSVVGDSNCHDFTTNRWEKFNDTVFNDESLKHISNNDIDIVIQTIDKKDNNYICAKYFPYLNFNKQTSLITLKNDDKYSGEKFCNLFSLLTDDDSKEAIEFVKIIFKTFFQRYEDEIVKNSNIDNNIGIMAFSRGMQVPFVHVKIRFKEEFIKLRYYLNVKINSRYLLNNLTETTFKQEGGSKCPIELMSYNKLFNLYDSTDKNDTDYEYIMKNKKLLHKLQDFGLKFTDALVILNLASQYIIDKFSLEKKLKFDEKKIVELIQLSENIFKPYVPYYVDYKFYNAIKKKVSVDTFIQIKNLLRSKRITLDTFYFINDNLSDDIKTYIIKEGNKLYYDTKYNMKNYQKYQNKILVKINNIGTAQEQKELFLKFDENNNIDSLTLGNIYFYAYDKNNNNKLSLEEFTSFVQKQFYPEHNTITTHRDYKGLDIEPTFNYYDFDKSKLLSPDEFRFFVEDNLNKYLEDDGFHDYKRHIQHYEFTKKIKKLFIGGKPDLKDLSIFYYWVKQLIILDNIRYYININPTGPDDIEKIVFEELGEKLIKGDYGYLHLPVEDYSTHQPKYIKQYLELMIDGERKGNVLMHCGAGDGRSGIFLFSLLVMTNLEDDYYTITSKFLCSYQFWAFREIFGDPRRYNLLVNRLISIYITITKMLDNGSNTFKTRPKFLKIRESSEDFFMGLVKIDFEGIIIGKLDYISYKFYEDGLVNFKRLNITEIFDDESNYKIDELFDEIKDLRDYRDMFYIKSYWTKLEIDLFNKDKEEYLEDKYYIFKTDINDINEKNNYNIINDYLVPIRTGDKESIIKEEDINWLFEKEFISVFTKYFPKLFGEDTAALLVDELLTMYYYINNSLNDYKTDNHISENDIIFYLKGGYLFYLIYKNSLKLPILFDELFDKSDIDLEVYINKDIDNYIEHFKNVNIIIYNKLNDYVQTQDMIVFRNYYVTFEEEQKEEILKNLQHKFNAFDKTQLKDDYKNIDEIVGFQFYGKLYIKPGEGHITIDNFLNLPHSLDDNAYKDFNNDNTNKFDLTTIKNSHIITSNIFMDSNEKQTIVYNNYELIFEDEHYTDFNESLIYKTKLFGNEYITNSFNLFRIKNLNCLVVKMKNGKYSLIKSYN